MLLQATIDASCQRLESIAASIGTHLSFEPSSVEQLEQVVLALRSMKADEDAMSGATFMVGTYLGEILRTRLGGAWQHSTDGELMLTVQNTSFFPVAKARKFAANPSGADGLSFFVNAALAGDA